MLENGTGCGCPDGMVKDGDNCTCPVGFALQGAAGCKGEKGHNQCCIEGAVCNIVTSINQYCI